MPTIVTVAAALAGAYVFERLSIPAGSLLGAVAAVAAVNLLASFDPVMIPSSVKFLAFAALGWAIGEGVTRETLQGLRSSFGVIVIVVVVLVVVGALTAWLLTATGMTDSNSAYLAASPGALSQISALANETGADTLLVTTTHTIRVIVVVMVTPVITNLLIRGVPA